MTVTANSQPRTVAGYCPMGCGQTLVVDDGRVVCMSQICARPDAVDVILGDPETQHVVQFHEETFDIIHPLRERLDGDLLRCPLHNYLRDLDGPPATLGRYRTELVGGDALTWEWLSAGDVL